MASTRIDEYDIFQYKLNAIKPEWRNAVSLQDLTTDHAYFNDAETAAIKYAVEHWNDTIDDKIRKEIMMANTNDGYITAYSTSITPDNTTKTKHTKEDYEIKDFEIVVPEKVVKVRFTDGTVEKMVCHEEDTYDLRWCLFVAIAKKLYKNRYTWEGIEHKAKELTYMKAPVKMVDKLLKKYYKAETQRAEAVEKARLEEERRAKKKAKHEKYLKRRDEKRQREIDEKNRQQFEYDVAVQVEAARRIADMNHIWNNECVSEWDGK